MSVLLFLRVAEDLMARGREPAIRELLLKTGWQSIEAVVHTAKQKQTFK